MHQRDGNGDHLSPDSFRTIGIVGGMSPESTLVYYRRLIELSQQRLGEDRYPRIVIASANFQPYVRWQHEGQWEEVAGGVAQEFESLAAAGAEFGALATNTVHKVLPLIEAPIPVLSIIDVVARAARGRGWGALGLTGTDFTMSDGHYQRELEARGVSVVVPEPEERRAVHAIIYDELVRGVVRRASVDRYASICRRLIECGAGGALLGCTELGMLARHEAWPADLPLIDSTEEHIEAIWSESVRGRFDQEGERETSVTNIDRCRPVL